MGFRIAVLLAALCLTGAAAAPAFADTSKLKTCSSRGEKKPVAIDFPRNDGRDMEFARATTVAVLPSTSALAPSQVTCVRATATGPTGSYTVGGENKDAYPRVAVPSGGGPGPVYYLFPVKTAPNAKPVYVLVGSGVNGRNIAQLYFSAMPGDPELLASIVVALHRHDAITSYDLSSNVVAHHFLPPGATPPAITSPQKLANGSTLEAGSPQVMIGNQNGPPGAFLDPLSTIGLLHKPSGYACPYSFGALPVLLNYVNPGPDGMACNYRAGTDLAYVGNAPIRYQLAIDRIPPSESVKSVFDALSAQAKTVLKITGERAPPVAAGPLPAPEMAAMWDTESGETQGLWMTRAGGWIVRVRAQYPTSAENDAEAVRVVTALFAIAAAVQPPGQPVTKPQ